MSRPDDFDPDDTAGSRAVPTIDRIWHWLCEQYEPATAAQIAMALGINEDTATRHLSTLQREGRALCVGNEPSDSRRRYGARLWVALDTAALAAGSRASK